jgi:bifunctional isochorismate lyase / aryl carrier protein
MTQTERPALLVLDVQNYFFQQGSPAYLKDSGHILPNIRSLLGQAVREQWPVVVTTHRAPESFGNLMERKWRRLPEGTECSLYTNLNVPESAFHISKEYYSAFFRTNLEEYLRRQGVRELVVCGVMTHLCVDTTVRHAFMLGFSPIIVSDACCSKDASYHEGAIRALHHGFADIVTTDQLRDART